MGTKEGFWDGMGRLAFLFFFERGRDYGMWVHVTCISLYIMPGMSFDIEEYMYVYRMYLSRYIWFPTPLLGLTMRV